MRVRCLTCMVVLLLAAVGEKAVGLDEPVIQPDGGTFEGPVMVAVDPQADGGVLRVTVDGEGDLSATAEFDA